MRLFKRLRRRASALIITLALVVLMTIIAIGMFTATRMEVAASKLHLDGVRADQLAQVGRSVALAKLQSGLAGTNRAWMSQPGRLVTSPTNALLPVTNIVELHSGLADVASLPDEAANLNPALLQDPSGNLLLPPSSFSGGETAMRVKWLYVRKDGTFDTNLPPAVDPVNPVTGRFAFWVDDEATKINANTAWTRSSANTNISSDPSRIDLGAVLNDTNTATALVAYRTASNFFNSPLDIRSASTSVAVAQAGNLITHYNVAPNLNMFGEKRIMLTTRKDLAVVNGYTNDFLDIYMDGYGITNTASADGTVIDYQKTSRLIRRILATLDRTDWPIQPGTNYSGKFGGEPGWAVQTIADIIEYVRNKESASDVVFPLQYNKASGKWLTGPNELAHEGGQHSLGTTRGPVITELGVWISPTKIANKYDALCFAEIYLPVGSIANLTDYKFAFGLRVPSWTTNWGGGRDLPIVQGPVFGIHIPGVAYLDSLSTGISYGEYRTISVYFQGITATGASTVAGGFTSARPTELTLMAALSLVTPQEPVKGETVTRSPANNSPDSTGMNYLVDGTNVASSAITSMSSIDPFVAKAPADFYQGPNSFGFRNPASPAYSDPAAFFPQLDADSTGSVVTNGTKIPGKKGAAGNSFGVVESVAELGGVPIGLNGGIGPGVPWRTIRLQPVKQGRADLPDWALLDLFCVPSNTNVSTNVLNFIRPPTGNLGGVVNLNAKVLPFVESGTSPMVTRALPARAFLSGARTNGTNSLSSTDLDSVLSNLGNRTLATAGGNQGRMFGSGAAADLYFSGGQIVEVAGVADDGEASEALSRDLIDLAATRSSVFTVYSLGQSIFQDKAGKIRVLAESRQANMVEVINNGGVPDIRPIFSKKLKP